MIMVYPYLPSKNKIISNTQEEAGGNLPIVSGLSNLVLYNKHCVYLKNTILFQKYKVLEVCGLRNRR